jgi:hypothetical protein
VTVLGVGHQLTLQGVPVLDEPDVVRPGDPVVGDPLADERLGGGADIRDRRRRVVGVEPSFRERVTVDVHDRVRVVERHRGELVVDHEEVRDVVQKVVGVEVVGQDRLDGPDLAGVEHLLCEQAVDLQHVRHLAGVEPRDGVLQHVLVGVLELHRHLDVRLVLEVGRNLVKCLPELSPHRVPHCEFVRERVDAATAAVTAVVADATGEADDASRRCSSRPFQRPPPGYAPIVWFV